MSARIGTDLEWLRTQFIVALAERPELRALLVLKGGAALALAHRLGLRASVDIDYSIAGDADDPAAFGELIFDALRARLEPMGLAMFDELFSSRPDSNLVGAPASRWGGYSATFKLIRRERFDAHSGDLERIRREALSVTGDPQAARTFRVEISKFEHCEPSVSVVMADGVACQVYSLELLAAEKLRALCQQMTEYERRRHPAPRARDFYDLHALLTNGRVDLADEHVHDLLRAVFGAKEVPLELLMRLEAYREFHRADWPGVRNAIPAGRSGDFDFYVDFVVAEVRKVSKPLGMEDAP